MGAGKWSGSDGRADVFFAQFVDASPEVVAAVVAEGRGDLARVVEEDREFGYWARVVQGGETSRRDRSGTRIRVLGS